MTRLAVTQFRDTLADALGRVRYARARVIVHSRGKDIACVVPIEDLEPLEDLEDRGLRARAEDARARSERTLSVSDARRELGL